MWVCPQDGWTALHLAAQEGKLDVVRLLTEAQAQVNAQTEVSMMHYSLTCFHCTSTHQLSRMAKLHSTLLARMVVLL